MFESGIVPKPRELEAQADVWKYVFFYGDMVTSDSPDSAVRDPIMSQLRSNLQALWRSYSCTGTHHPTSVISDMGAAVSNVNEGDLCDRVKGVGHTDNPFLIYSKWIHPFEPYYLLSRIGEHWKKPSKIVANYVATSHFAFIFPDSQFKSQFPQVLGVAGPVGIAIDNRSDVLEKYETAVAFTQFLEEVIRQKNF